MLKKKRVPTRHLNATCNLWYGRRELKEKTRTGEVRKERVRAGGGRWNKEHGNMGTWGHGGGRLSQLTARRVESSPAFEMEWANSVFRFSQCAAKLVVIAGNR